MGKKPDTLYDPLYAETVAAHLNKEETEEGQDIWKYAVEYFGAKAAVMVSDEEGYPLGYL